MKTTEQILGQSFSKLMNDEPAIDCLQKAQSIAYCLGKYIYHTDMSLDDMETKTRIHDVFQVIDAFCQSSLVLSNTNQTLTKAA